MIRTHAALLAAGLALAVSSSARGQFDPNAFPSLGTLNVTSGTLTINTDSLTMSGAASFTGVAINQPGGPQVAVFDFGSITIGSGVTMVTLTGSRPLVLLSRGNATVQPAITVPVGGLGGYAGGSLEGGTANGYTTVPGSGPGGGGASFTLAGGSSGLSGGGGYGGRGGNGSLGGPAYGNLFGTLDGGSGGGLSVLAPTSGAFAGSGGGALEIVASGSLTVASTISAQGSGFAGAVTNASGSGGAGGGILLSGGTGLTLSGQLFATGGNGNADPNFTAGGGGGGLIALGGLPTYTLGATVAGVTLTGGNGFPVPAPPVSGPVGYAGVLTVDALNTTIPSATTVTLTGGPLVSIAGSVNQTTPTVLAYARRSLTINGAVGPLAPGVAILGATNAFQQFDLSGNNITGLVVNGTFDLNGFNETVDSLSGTLPTASVKLPAGSTLTAGVNNSSSSFAGQFTGAGALVKLGTGTLTLSGASLLFTGTTTVIGGALSITSNQGLQNSTVTLSGGALSFPANSNPVLGALAGTGNLSLTGLTSLTVGGNNASTTYAGNLAGSATGGLTKAGTGTWTLTGTNTQTGPFAIQAGTVLVGSAAALSATAPVTVAAPATLDLNGNNYAVSKTNPLTVLGTLRVGTGSVTVGAGATATYNGGTVLGGFLRGTGTHVVTGGATLNGVTTFNSTNISVTGGGTFQNFVNGGSMNAAAGIPAASTITLDGFSNEGSGSITVGAGSTINVSDFQSYGTLTLNPATGSPATRLTNTGTTPLSFNGGSRTFIATPATAGQNAALVDLHGQNAVVAGGLFVNNGFVGDSTNSGATVIADYGALVKGAGIYANAVITQNGGRFQAGNSPGKSTFGQLVLGPGGTQNFNWQINNATGPPAGPTADQNNQVSGWSQLGVQQLLDPLTGNFTTGNLNWTATSAAGTQFNMALQTLINPITVGQDTLGLMANFNNQQNYIWKFVQWQGTYTGPTDDVTLTSTALFDTSNFLNPIDPAGRFSLHYDASHKEIDVIYSVPEPGTFVLFAFAAIPLVRRSIRLRL